MTPGVEFGIDWPSPRRSWAEKGLVLAVAQVETEATRSRRGEKSQESRVRRSRNLQVKRLGSKKSLATAGQFALTRKLVFPYK